MQSSTIYHSTLGRISNNYQLTEKDGSWHLQEVKTPFISITNENILQWDARIYQCIKEKGYDHTPGCYHNVRGAFFPLFPWFWACFGTPNWIICLVNYFVFAFSLCLLIKRSFLESSKENIYYFILFLTVPSTIIFFLPYSESLFFLGALIALFGIHHKRYRWFFIGAFLLALTRAASIFVLFGFLFTEILLYVKGNDLKSFFKACLERCLPFLGAYFIVWFIQYLQSGSATHFFEAHALWPKETGWPSKISDWSKEGFGMNLFSLIYIAIPGIVFLFHLIWKKQKEWIQKHYILVTSLFYLGGMFLFKLLFSGGNLHSTFRFIMATPFFYLVVLHLLTKKKSIYFPIVLWGGALIFVILGLNFIDYGKPRFSFPLLGLFLAILWAGLVLFDSFLSKKIKHLLTAFIWLCHGIWTCYLFNAYLSEGWIFT